MGSDMICQHSFGEIADLHRSRGSDLTMLLVSAPSEDSEKKGTFWCFEWSSVLDCTKELE
jgi:ADP-glucose pyrophosphorylase